MNEQVAKFLQQIQQLKPPCTVCEERWCPLHLGQECPHIIYDPYQLKLEV